MSPAGYRVMIVSANPRLRGVLPALLRREAAIAYRGSVAGPEEALVIARTQPLDVIVSDQAPANTQHVLTWRAIRDHGPQLVMLTRYFHSDADIRSVLAGAAGLVLVPERRLIDAVMRVAGGDILRSDALNGRLHAIVSGEAPSPLDGDERRFLGLIVDGHADREIAAIAGVSSEEAREHVMRIAEKLG